MFTGMFAKMKGKQLREANGNAGNNPPATGQSDYDEVQRTEHRFEYSGDEQCDNMHGFPKYPGDYEQRAPLPCPPCRAYDGQD